MITAILQARMSSTRLPGKVLKPILGRPMLARQLERLKRCSKLDRLVVATSSESEDDALARLCSEEKITCFRGSLKDVLDRFYQCAKAHDAKHVVRLTGDCPLIDPGMVDALIDFYLKHGADYASNCRPPTLPDGLDAEIFSFAALKTAWEEAREPFAREHVTPFIVRNPGRFSVLNWAYRENLAHLRWTVDEPEDFEFVSRIYENLYLRKPDFTMTDVLELLAHQPALGTINALYQRKPGCETDTAQEKKQ